MSNRSTDGFITIENNEMFLTIPKENMNSQKITKQYVNVIPIKKGESRKPHYLIFDDNHNEIAQIWQRINDYDTEYLNIRIHNRFYCAYPKKNDSGKIYFEVYYSGEKKSVGFKDIPEGVL